MKKNLWVIITGVVIGVAALALVQLGNPANMGFCIACFLRDIAGACKLHGAAPVQYIRPEIIGLTLGAFLIALIKKDFKPRGGSSPFTRFLLGFIVMVGALMFLGCPLRMAIRIGGGDLNAVVGLVGFCAGIGVGVVALNKGFSLRRAYEQSVLEGGLFPVLMLVLLALSLAVPSLFAASESGPGSLHAPVAIALVIGLVVGVFAQRSRFCFAGGWRDTMAFRDLHLLWGFLALIATVLVGNLILGKFNLGFEGQPIAHTDGVWNFLGMAAVGWGSVLLGGCPLRQLILAGEGNSDSAVTITGFVVGAAFAHNFGLASSADGPTANGMIAVAAGLVVLGIISIMNLAKKEN
ncbi:MAG: YedE-related selenium metabolism membrane protein [Clostridiales bacterium]|nr:YedE-related selenium metabolism membrane protein [Clostridiales bacterium]